MKQKRIMKGLLLTALAVCAGQVSAKDVMCLKTNTGQYIEVVRVSMLVIPDGGNTFEIVVRDGQGASGVESVSFETHASDIDLSKYQGGSSSGSSTIDVSKPVWLVTNTGKHFLVKDVSMLASISSARLHCASTMALAASSELPMKTTLKLSIIIQSPS